MIVIDAGGGILLPNDAFRGLLSAVDHDLLRQVLTDAEAEAALVAMVPKLMQELEQIPQQVATAIPEDVLHHTLGVMD